MDDLTAAVAAESSLSGVLRRLALRPAGGNHTHVGYVIRTHKLCIDHWTRKGHRRGLHNPHAPKTPIKQVLIHESTFRSSHLRRRLIDENILAARCSNCLGTQWEGRPIPLEIDHIDGDRFNNELANLRLLCPNCHALTPTYRGKNVALRRSARV